MAQPRPRQRLTYAEVVKVTQVLDAHRRTEGARRFKHIASLMEHIRKQCGVYPTDKQLRSCLQAIEADMSDFVSSSPKAGGKPNPMTLAWERIKQLEEQVEDLTTAVEKIVEMLEVRKSLENRSPALRDEGEEENFRLLRTAGEV